MHAEREEEIPATVGAISNTQNRVAIRLTSLIAEASIGLGVCPCRPFDQVEVKVCGFVKSALKLVLVH